MPSPDDVAAALDTIGHKPIDPTNAALMGLTWRKALQRGFVSEEELVAALRDHLRAIGILVMLVGIGFLSLLIGSVSERFLAAEVKEEVAEAERELEEDVDAVRAELLAEFREMGERLRHLEKRVEGARRL